MKNYNIFLIIGISILTLTLSLGPFLNEAVAQSQYIPPRQQWKMTTDPSQIVCPSGMGMMMSVSGNPACVTSSTYLRLVDRGWGNYDFNQMTTNQQFMTGIMNNMMYHPRMMGYMMNDPQSLQYMQQNNQWMGMMKGGKMMGGPMMGQGMMMGNYTTGCPWCPVTSGTGMPQGWMMHNPQQMQGMMGYMMNDPEFRQQMFEHMLNNQQFMQNLMQNQTFMRQFNP